MPLLNFDQPHYLNRKRIFIDSDQKDVESESNWNILYTLNQEYTKVQGIELVDYNIPRQIMPTFFEETITSDGIISGNNIIDVYMTDLPVTQDITFSVILPPGRYSTSQALYDDLLDYITEAMDAQGDPFFNTTNNVTFGYQTTTYLNGNYVWINPLLLGVTGSLTMTFLFKTGVNRTNSAWKVLGFPRNQDVGYMASIPVYGPRALNPININPYTYIDISIKEFPELGIIARIFMNDNKTNTNYTTNPKIENRYRLLQSYPLRKIRRMNIILTFEDNIIPIEKFNLGYDLIFDMLILSPEQNIPCWTKQALTF